MIMARYTKGALGAFSGKLGNVVGSSWRHINYLRSLPKPSKKPATQLQLAQRAKFALAISFLSTIKDILNIGFGDAKRGRNTGYNEAVSSMLKNSISGTYPDYEIDYPDLELSRGSLSGLIGLTMIEDMPMEILFTWENLTNRFNAFDDDDLVVVLYNETKKLFSVYEEAQRKDGSLNVTLPMVFGGDEIVAWVFLVKRDGDTTSDSQYAGSLTLTD
jgi:hypothetical protein